MPATESPIEPRPRMAVDTLAVFESRMATAKGTELEALTHARGSFILQDELIREGNHRRSIERYGIVLMCLYGVLSAGAALLLLLFAPDIDGYIARMLLGSGVMAFFRAMGVSLPARTPRATPSQAR